MNIIKKWLFGEVAEDFGPGSETKEPEKPMPDEPKKRGTFAKKPEDVVAGKGAARKRRENCEEALKAYTPTGPAFKIVQVPAGHFEIRRRFVLAADHFEGRYHIPSYLDRELVEWADVIEAKSCEPMESYETVKNTSAPIMTNSYGSYSRYDDSYGLTGYAPLAFNVFEDAEAYLIRIANPEEHETGYDFPPLKKRAKAKAKASAK